MRRWLFLCGTLLFLGCADNRLAHLESIARPAASQNFLAAANQVRDNPAFFDHSDLLYNMDLGLLYHYAGLYDSSIVFLEKAVKIQEDLYTHSVTNEAAALLTNDNIRPYRGRPYEITSLHLFLALDYLALHRNDDARVEVRQGEIFLDEVHRKNGTDPKAFQDDGAFRMLAALIYEELGEKDNASISLFQAVKAYQEAKQPVPQELARYAYVVLNDNGRSSDIQELGLTPVKPDAQDPVFGATEIVVVGELGRSPVLGETEFWGTWVRDGVIAYHYNDANGNNITGVLPAPGLPPGAYQGGNTLSGTTVHVKWTMPALKEVRSQSDVLRVALGPNVYSGEALTNTRQLLQQDLDANSTSTLVRTVTRVALRTLTAQEAKSKLVGNDPILNLLADLGVDALSDQLEHADTRLWFLLPRTLQIARIPVKPGHYTLELGADNFNGREVLSETRDVDVRAGEKKFVFFTSLK